LQRLALGDGVGFPPICDRVGIRGSTCRRPFRASSVPQSRPAEHVRGRPKRPAPDHPDRM